MQADLGTWQDLESQGMSASEAKLMQERMQGLDKTTSDLTTLLRDKRAQLAKAEERIEQLEHELAEVRAAWLPTPLFAELSGGGYGRICAASYLACSLKDSSLSRQHLHLAVLRSIPAIVINHAHRLQLTSPVLAKASSSVIGTMACRQSPRRDTPNDELLLLHPCTEIIVVLY